jgi:hypothetical protein
MSNFILPMEVIQYRTGTNGKVLRGKDLSEIFSGMYMTSTGRYLFCYAGVQDFARICGEDMFGSGMALDSVMGQRIRIKNPGRQN